MEAEKRRVEMDMDRELRLICDMPRDPGPLFGAST